MYHSIIYNMSHSKDTCSVQLYRYISTGDNHPAKVQGVVPAVGEQYVLLTVSSNTMVPDIVYMY